MMRHGGDLHEAARLHGEPREGWLDLSTGINPRPYPVEDAAQLVASLRRLPAPHELGMLLAEARAAFGLRETTAITAAPGTDILIRMLPRIIPSDAFLADTSYRSYGEAFAGSRRLDRILGVADAARQPGRSVLVVNPNNPDGRTIAPRQILDVARSRSGGALVVVDEAYADAEPGVSVVHHLGPDDPVLVLKSFGKFFGLPGLRLGFALGPPSLIRRLASEIGDWPVSGPAIAIATRALRDTEWQRHARHWLGNQAQAMDGVLRKGGLEPADGTRLFRTALADDSPDMHRRLARQGVWTRIFDDRPGLIRFGLPPDTDGLARLARAFEG